jgi:hypothetical protein
MKNTNEPMTQLLNGFKAPTEFYQEVHQNTYNGVDAMVIGELYKVKEIANKGYWATLPSNKWKTLAGRCFAHMVSTGQFPVKFVQYKKSRTKHYQKK